MATKYTLTPEKLQASILKTALPVVRQVVNEMYLGILSQSPVDTGRYIAGHRQVHTRIEKGRIIGGVENPMEYSERVEFGFGRNGWIGNRQTVVNWHLRNGTIYRNKGAFTYKRESEKAQNRLLYLLIR